MRIKKLGEKFNLRDNKYMFHDIYTGRWKYLTVRTIANFIYCKRKAILGLLFPKQVLKQKYVIMGKILHEVHYTIHKEGITHFKRKQQEIIAQLKAKWNLQDPEIIRELENKLTSLIKTHRTTSPARSIEAEVLISSKNGKIRGKIDLIMDGSIYEVKFPSKMITKPFLNDITQAFIYGILYKEAGNNEITHVFLEYPLFELVYKIDLEDEKLLEVTKNAVNNLVEYSFVEELPPLKRSRRCDYCELKELCWSL